MGVTDAFAHKRTMLVEALSKAAEVATRDHGITVDTLRSLFRSGITEWWREGELKLEPVWKMLCSQPGMTPQAVAPPMLLLRSLEAKLDVKVRLPDALSAIPSADQQRLLESIPPEVAAELTAAIDRARAEAEQAQAEEAAKQQTSQQLQKVEAQIAQEAAAEAPKTDEEVVQKKRRTLAFVLFPLAVLALAISLWFSLNTQAPEFDTTPYNEVLQLTAARRDGKSVTATLSDPKWTSLSKDDREKICRTLLDKMSGIGVEAITLLDQSGRVRAVVYTQAGSRNVLLH